MEENKAEDKDVVVMLTYELIAEYLRNKNIPFCENMFDIDEIDLVENDESGDSGYWLRHGFTKIFFINSWELNDCAKRLLSPFIDFKNHYVGRMENDGTWTRFHISENVENYDVDEIKRTVPGWNL